MAIMRVGTWSRVLIAVIGVMGSTGVLWLDIGGIADQVRSAFLFVFLPGLFLLGISFVIGRRVRAVASAPSDRLWMVVAVALLANLIFSFLAMVFLGGSLFPEYAVGDIASIAIIAVLFAVYEETHMMGIAAFMKTAAVPDWIILVITAVWFPMMHALAYAATVVMTAILAVGRLIFTSAALATDNTDAGFIAHVLWNLGAVL